jgi:hypothetical protein
MAVATRPAFSRIFFSITLAISVFCRMNPFAFSRPGPAG